MALRRRRDNSMIWPGFVDAVTTLLMVMMFVLTIFTVMQSVLRDTISTQSGELDTLTAQIAQLADALGLERTRADGLQAEVGTLTATLSQARADGERQAGLIDTLTSQLASKSNDLSAAQTQIASFEAQVATLLTERDAARGQVTSLTASVEDLRSAAAKLITDKEALDLALAKARTEIDAGTEAARLAAARREALEALLSDLRGKAEVDKAMLETTQAQLTAQEAARLVDAAALEALRAKLTTSDDELTAMTLALEEQRKRAEETLTLLAAAQSDAAKAVSVTDKRQTLLNVAELALSAEQEKSLEASRKLALLNEQMTALRAQLSTLQSMLDASAAKDKDANVQIENLGSQLNAALAQVASEQKRRAELEIAERKRLEAENLDLAKFRSEFFGQLREVLAGREGVRVVGDRFVFSSEVLFTPGSADLAEEGRAQIAGVVATLSEIADQIPPSIDWIIRVDGHTDAVPLSGTGIFKDNWELSQARALSVVRFMQNELGFPAQRLAATGFGEYQPVVPGDTPEALAQNRRIELKLTER
jgi:chemotaxis protein MotB